MRFTKRINWEGVARLTWTHVTVGILLLGLGTFLVESDGTVAFRNLMPFMILLSFPAGLAAFLLIWPFLDISPGVDFSILWCATFVAGYVQWFVVAPNLRSPGFVTLSLSEPLPHPIPNVPDELLESVSNPKQKSFNPRSRRMVHFDAAGRTPLERAIYFVPQKRTTRVK